MRTWMRSALIGAGAAALAILGLLVATALTGSQSLAVLTAVAGTIVVAAAVGLGIRATNGLTIARNRTATRLSNLERRLDRSRSAEAETADALSQLEASLEELAERSQDPQRLEMIEAELAAAARTLRVLRRRVPEGYLEPIGAEIAQLSDTLRAELAERDSRLRADLNRVGSTSRDAWILGTESALQLGRRPRSFLTAQQALDLFTHYLEQDKLLQAGPLITHYKVLDRLDLGTLRRLYRFYKAAGYWDLAVLTLRQVAQKSGRSGDRKAVTKLEREVAVFSRPESAVDVELPRGHAHDAAGPILHMVGKVLPETQSGYTLRTHYTAQAQSRRGLPVVVVGQSGITEGPVERITRYDHEGIDYYLLPGAPRGSMLVDEWLTANIQALGELVRRLRPSVLHAHSDFLNALIVHAVGRTYGIPTVYETRGFWEESWLTRAISVNGWGKNAENLFATYGSPSAYALRKHAEEVARTLADHNFTLAEVMKRHMLDAEAGLPADQVSIVPNAVEAEEFPIQDRDPALAERLGIPDDAVTIGYISSMVEYESIETLIDAFRWASGRTSIPLRLLLVGGGSHLEALQRYATDAGAENIVFTGAVPHDDVLRYYGVIDIFVVPRATSSVAELVTPLKPFEAFATGRAVVLSDVEALKEIAEQSGAAQTFRAGNHRDLGRKLAALVEDPQRRRDLGVRGARWVRSQRTWDRNVVEYYRVYRQLGYRGTADPALEASRRHHEQRTAAVPLIERSPRSARAHKAEAGTAPSEDGPAHRAPVPDTASPRLVPPSSSAAAHLPGLGRRAVVVAMKPQIAGRIRRNILTLLELGFEVTVVNSTPRADFFQGLEHPRLSADFVEVRSLAVRYQARMTRKKNERQAKWDLEKRQRARKAREPIPDAPQWMKSDLPGADILYRAWTSEHGRHAIQTLDRARTQADKRATKLLSETRQKRDLTIRDQLKQVHLVNRFVEFWRLSPDRIAAHDPDLIVSSDLPGLVGANIAARRLGVPHLHDCHELYLESTTLRPYERTVLWPVEKTYMRRADAVVIVNETIRDEYEKRYGVRGTVLRNAAPAVAQEIRTNPINLRALAGIPQSSRVVLYQGGLMPGRGLDVCVRAAAGFADGVHLVFIGKGKMLEELTALAEDLGVTDRVHFLPAVEPAELPAYTVAADVGVIPYQPVSRNNEYALPNKVFEYTGAGIPFVAADLRELRRIATSAQCGEVYDPFDPEKLAAAVSDVLDPQRYEAYRKNAETFGQDNTWEREQTILVSEIERLTADR